MAEEGSGLKPKTLKRKNVKGLMLAKSEPAAPEPPPTGHDLAGQLSTLEIGVEFKLDLRAEDLQVINELGAGNGGTVSKVMHQTLKTVMAKKVYFFSVFFFFPCFSQPAYHSLQIKKKLYGPTLTNGNRVR